MVDFSFTSTLKFLKNYKPSSSGLIGMQLHFRLTKNLSHGL